MANAATPPTSPASLKGTANSSGYDQFVDSRIAKTRTAVKSADLATGAVVLLAWALVVVLVAAIADHWLVAGGLDRWERYSLWGIGLAGAALYTATRLGPNLLRSVNPLYAAREIERESPALKNSVLNLLQLRGAAESPSVKQALERQAAERLANAGDAPIDHTPLVRAAKLLLALVALVGVYVVASPKDFFASAGRVLAPWSQIAAPTRVRITAIEPGAVTLAQGDRLNIAAMVSGLRADELVELVYTTDDRQAVGRRVPMTASRGGLQFTGAIPAGSGATVALGVQGSLTYRIEAGDAHSASYHVDVLTAPTIAPVSVRYDYPAYTGFEPRTVEGGGDLRGLQGTRVTLDVEANLPIDSAQIDIGADGRPDVRMTAEGKKAQAAFALRLDGPGPSSTNSYVLRFTSPDGQANNDPPQYQIEVLADLAPEAAILEPEAETTDVALHQRAPVVVEARDPDFALKRVRLVGDAGGRRVLDQELLEGNRRGRFRSETEITPHAIGLRPGDVLDFWVEATDNRTPQPNVTVSQRRQLRVLAPAEGQQGDRRDGEAGEGQQQPGADGDPQQGQQQEGENGEGQPGEPQQDGGAAGQSNQGQGNQGQPNQGQPNEGQQDEQQQPGEAGQQGQQNGQSKSQAGEEKDSQGEDGQPPPGGLTGPGNEGGSNSSDQSGDGNEGSNTSKPKEGANSPAGGSQAGEPGADQQPPAGQQDGQNGGDLSAAGKPSPANQQPGDQPPGGEPAAGEQPGGEGASESPVARDGSDDGSAFDKMLDWMKQQQGDNQSGKPSPNNQRNTDNPNEGASAEGGQDTQQPSGDQSRNDDQTQKEGQTQEGQGSEGASQQREARDQQSKANDQNQSSDQAQPNDGRDGSGSDEDGGQDGESDANDMQDVEGESNGRQGERGKEGRGGDGKQQSRNQAGGEQPDRNEQGPGASEQDRSGEQSNSQSSESGGDKPPGESTERDAGPREGADGAGQSQAADRGAGQSADKGAGDTSGRAGGEEKSDSPTGGESGDERGAGSNSRESESSDGKKSGAGDKQPGDKQPGGQKQDNQPKEPSASNEGQPDQPFGQPSGDESRDSSGADRGSEQPNSLDDKRGEGARDGKNPAGQGGPMELGDRGATSDAAGEGAESGGEAANLDYAREQTELVLKRLEEQLSRKEVDRKLLDKLGWTDEDLREFVDRWQSRRKKSAERGAEGEAELDRALRSLGLSPNGPTAKSKVTEDSLRDLRESARAKTPPRLRDSVERYLRSINAADDGLTEDTPAGEK